MMNNYNSIINIIRSSKFSRKNDKSYIVLQCFVNLQDEKQLLRNDKAR